MDGHAHTNTLSEDWQRLREETVPLANASDCATNALASVGKHWRGALDDVSQFTRIHPWPALTVAPWLGWRVGRAFAPRGRRYLGDSSSAAGVRWPPRTQSPPALAD